MIVENLEIIDMSEQGQGIAKKDNLVYFVKNAILGEIVNAKIVEEKKNLVICVKENTLKDSPYYEKSKCEYFEDCSGCTIQNIEYRKQLELKKVSVKNQLQRIGNIEVENLEIKELEDPFNYRNKVELKVDEKSNIGYYYEKSHRLVKIDKCIIANEKINEIIKELSEIIKKYSIKGYNHKFNKGEIKNITIRSNYLNEGQITITTSKKEFKNKEEFFEDIKNIENIVEIYHSVNKKKNSETIGDEIKLISSTKEYRDKIGEYEFKISPKSFFQVNSKNTKNLYDIALKQMKLKGQENILDMYCGIGTTTIYFGKDSKKTIGVEIVPDAIKDGKYNSKLNKLDNIEFVLGKSEEKIEKLLDGSIDIVIVDPPRKGLDKELVEKIGKSKVKRFEYISCNPATLSRDIKILGEFGFKVEEIELCDMFPHTMHVEALTLLSRA